MIQIDQYLGIFLDESRENLQTLNECLLLLEENRENLAIVNDIFRVAHTLKGMSSTMGYSNIADLTHKMENLLDPLRNGTLKVNDNTINVLFKCLDTLEKLLETVVNGNYQDGNISVTGIVNEIEDILGAKSPAVKYEEAKMTPTSSFEKLELTEDDKSKVLANQQNALIVKQVSVKIDDDSLLPTARAYMVYKNLENFSEIIKSLPTLSEIEVGEFSESYKNVFRLLIATDESDETLTNTILEISEIVETNIITLDKSCENKEENNVASSEAKSEEVVNKSSEKSTQLTNNPKAIAQTIRVNADKMDKLMNLVGELVISRTRIAQLSMDLKSMDLSNSVGQMSTITTDIQEIVMKLRMVEIDQVFSRFPRLVRDVSKELQKDINFVITGKETEIDRVVVDQIGDPLVHLMRNSLDHGLETTEERKAKGKNPRGLLELSAFNEGNNIIIKVKDDGKGIDPEKIRASAVKKGIITKEQAKHLNENESLDLIFAAGLSTKDVATDMSGRGVGMDVVKTKVTSLGGNVSISSVVGEGTTVTITLPSTMAIVQSLLIKIFSETYAMPLNYISEVLEIEQRQLKTVQKKEVLVLRGKTLPLIRLSRLLNVDSTGYNEPERLTVVVVKYQEKFLGLVVSELIGQQEVVIKPISKKLCSEDYISGATTLGNGQVALIFNINALFNKS